ncbi:helix-turn-helix domain-containing protein [Streptococcus dysgalactiae]|uniref:helix-turn-helix domain-containing protein n=1 Tax=Streptococcus dysgalactiae TaxID=1334 RepID=UPI001C9DCB19|nr:helix-turn-helix transcriptional regulator [Streptococcus dysgalactiae]QZT27682.1 helix-turn-helix domain-containing protein [Streptococcus dysgalactiae]
MNRLKELRKDKKQTQKELAQDFGVALRTLQSWENGESQIKPDKTQQLADYFGVSVGYLLGYATVDDVMELTAKVMTNQIRLEDISDKNTRKAVSDYIELNKGLEPNQPFKTDYSMLNAIEKINDIKLVDEMITDSMLANRVLDRLRSYMMESGIISPDSYNWEIERVMTWLIDFNDELFKRKVSLSGGKISSSYSQDYRNNDLYKTDNDS